MNIIVTLFICTGTVLGTEVRITNDNDFIAFSNNVNSGISNYSGTTVYLDSDLSLSGTFDPIGSNYQFCGTFDGQGYVISNLKINSISQFTGLFGYSEGLVIKNVVLGSSCSISSSYSLSTPFVGGIIGRCESNNFQCSIENCVNMGSVTLGLSGNCRNLRLGGITGQMDSSSKYKFCVSNCANYGPVVKFAVCDYSWIGGIAGLSVGNSSSNYNSIQNCLNYGTIEHSGKTKTRLGIGGIVGFNYYTYIENCASAGKMTLSNIPSDNYQGSVVGYAYSNTYINYCYFTNEVGLSNLYDTRTSYSPLSTKGTPVSSTIVNPPLIANLNGQASSKGWNKWLLNSNNNLVAFKVNNNNGLFLSSSIILLPDLVSDSLVFSGWYDDDLFSSSFSSPSVSSDTFLYGGWLVIVTLNANGGDEFTPSTKEVIYNNIYGDLPTLLRTGYNFTGWYKAKGGNDKIESSTKVTTANHHTIYAHWSAKKYTVSFNVSGGNNNLASVNVTYGEKYKNLANAARTGYTFVGWFFNESSIESVTNDTDVTIPYPHTLYARWRINSYTVTFDPNNGENVVVKMFEYNSEISYPKFPEKRGYTFSGWDNGTLKLMPAENITVKARWIPMNYTVTLDVNGGDVPVNNKVVVTFNSTYGVLPVPTREGYSFVGWFNDENEIVRNEIIVNKTEKHTLYAHWEEIPTSQVEITFDTKVLSKEDVVSVIKQYTDDTFNVVSFEDTPDGIKVIVKFNDSGKAEEFVRTVKSTSDSTTKSLIKWIDFNSKEDVSLSSPLLLYPFLFFLILVL